MPLLLLIPLLVVGAVLLWALLLPLLLVQRWRLGRRRQRALGWVVAVNVRLLWLSLAGYALGAWAAGAFGVPGALAHAGVGVAAGAVLGAVGLALTRWEADGTALWFTPNRWFVLGLTLVIAARIGWGMWTLARSVRATSEGTGLSATAGAEAAVLLAVAGVLLGHQLVHTSGLRRRLKRVNPSTARRVPKSS